MKGKHHSGHRTFSRVSMKFEEFSGMITRMRDIIHRKPIYTLKRPHFLLTPSSGSGKTYLMKVLIRVFLIS